MPLFSGRRVSFVQKRLCVNMSAQARALTLTHSEVERTGQLQTNTHRFHNFTETWHLCERSHPLPKMVSRLHSSSFRPGQSRGSLTAQEERGGGHLHHAWLTVRGPGCSSLLPGARAVGTPGVACQKPLGADVLHYSVPAALGGLLHLLDQGRGL